MDQETLNLIIGPTGGIVVLALIAAACARGLYVLYNANQILHDKRVAQQEKFLELVESQRDYHMEAQKVLTKSIVLMERVEQVLDELARTR